MGNAQVPGSCSDMEHADPETRTVKGRGLASSASPEKEGGFHQAGFWYEKMRENKASQDLFHAAVCGDVKASMAALVQHGNPNCCNAEGLTSLMMAAAGGHIEVARLLVTSGAKLNAAPCPHGLSALGLAAAGGHLDIVRLLLQWRADPNVGRTTGSSPLSRAAGAGRVEVVAMLLDTGAELDAYDSRGVTAAMLAVERHHLELVQLFVEGGASMAATDKNGRSCLSRAIDLLLRMEPLGKTPGALRSPMSEYEYWAEMCNIMLERKANPDQVDSKGDTLLCIAVRNRRADVVGIICNSLRAEKELPVPSLSGATVLSLAVEQGARDLCQQLILSAADVNASATNGVTPLVIAIDKGDESMCFYLLQCGAQPDGKDPRTGQSLLMKAAARGLRQLYDRLRPHLELAAISGTHARHLEDAGPTDDDEDGAEYEYITETDDEGA